MSTDQKEVASWIVDAPSLFDSEVIEPDCPFEVVQKSDYDALRAKVEELEGEKLRLQSVNFQRNCDIKAKDAEIAKLREALSKDRLLEVIEDWQMIWRNQNINPEDTKRYRRRALSVDANMRSSLARMISEKALNKGGE